ncbi:hypothetical protein HYU93_04200 [Candidatus Daviesbacteria bacterium]|nr:hypothetical protein [Candidatus Daviesbacteria bacterium]
MHFDYAQCKQKGSVQLLVIIAILLFIGGSVVYFLSSQKKNKETLPTPYNSYNNYSNQSLGFEFQYADKALAVKGDSEEEFNKRGNGNFRKNFKGYVGYEPGKPLGAVAVLDKTASYETNPFSVWVFDNPNELAVDKWFDNYWYYPFVWGVFDWTSKSHIAPDTEATISGQLAKSKIIAYQPGKPKFIYIKNKDKMYLIRLFEGEGDKLLSTFKFLE